MLTSGKRSEIVKVCGPGKGDSPHLYLEDSA